MNKATASLQSESVESHNQDDGSAFAAAQDDGSQPLKPPVPADSQLMKRGFLYCLGSSIGYTVANVFLRAVTEADPVWISCVKAVPMVMVIIPWLVYEARQGKPFLPPWRLALGLVLVSLLANFGGNVIFQWSLGVIGVALSAPLTLGAMIISGALLGRVFLAEGISGRAAVSCILLLAGIGVLTLGASDAGASVAGQSAGVVFLGVQAAVFAGVAYATMGVVMRYGLRKNVSAVSTLATISVVGVVSLTIWAHQRIGLEGMQATTAQQWMFMVLAGIANTAAFVCLTKALETTSLLMVNAVNASQAAFCGVAGVVIFGEALTLALGVGLALTVLGLLAMKR